MPRLRHRLRSRRGSTRGPSTRHRRSPSATATSSSSAASLEQPPRARYQHGYERRRRVPSPPRQRTAVSRPPEDSRPALSAPIQNPSTIIFHFQSNSDRPLVITTVTVSFKEIPEITPAPPPVAPSVNVPAHSSPLLTTIPAGIVASRKGGECSSSIPQAEGLQVGIRDAEAAAAQSGPSHHDEDAGWCRIEEEPPSGEYDL